jgi:prepilin peptidase CpaA
MGEVMVEVLPMLALVLSTLVVLSDFYARRVPNTWLAATLAIAVVTALLQWITAAPQPVWPSIPGLATGLLTLLPFYAIGWMGAGDVKFFATLGFLLGVRALLPIWVIACLMTGVHAIATLLFRAPRVAYAPGVATVRQRLHAWPLWRRSLLARQGRTGQPHAAYLGIATFITVLQPELMHWGRP